MFATVRNQAHLRPEDELNNPIPGRAPTAGWSAPDPTVKKGLRLNHPKGPTLSQKFQFILLTFF